MYKRQGEERTLREVIAQMDEEMPQLSTQDVEAKMLATLRTLRGADVVLGPKKYNRLAEKDIVDE